MHIILGHVVMKFECINILILEISPGLKKNIMNIFCKNFHRLEAKA